MDINNLTNKYDFKKIKNGYSYNGAKLRITEIRRKDGEHMTRKAKVLPKRKLANQSGPRRSY
jgi:hypothetical protein